MDDDFLKEIKKFDFNSITFPDYNRNFHMQSFENGPFHDDSFERTWILLISTFIIGVAFFVVFLICCRLCNYKSHVNNQRSQQCIRNFPPPPPLTDTTPVVVTTTTIPVPPSGFPAQQPTGYPMPQPQPGFAPQPYPHPTPGSYPMPQPQTADHNPPSYDQVMRGGDAYQKQAPYNPNYAGHQ